MARQIRIEYAGAFYHVMARGDRREAIVRDDEDRSLFLKTLEEACLRTGWRVHAWILMGNHYHLALETPEPNLVAGMKWFQNTFTRRINCKHRLWGHVFGGRYRAIVVDGKGDAAESKAGRYLGTLIDYIHLNPIRAKIIRVRENKGLLDYAWSSLRQDYAVPLSKRRAFVDVSRGLAAHQLKDNGSGRRNYVRVLETIAREESAGECGYREIEGQTLNSTLARGWYWGNQAFREKLLGMLKKRKIGNRNYRSSSQGRARGVTEAEELISEGFKHFGIGEKDIESTSGTYRPKVAIAWSLHARTTISQGWIAERLHMKTASNVSQQIRRWLKSEKILKENQWEQLVKKC